MADEYRDSTIKSNKHASKLNNTVAADTCTSTVSYRNLVFEDGTRNREMEVDTDELNDVEWNASEDDEPTVPTRAIRQEAVFKRYIDRLPKEYELTKKGLQLMADTTNDLKYAESPAGCTRSQQSKINELSKKLTAVAAYFSDDPSELLVLPTVKKN